ncbi:hypothetical protein MYX77_07425 [Acidobacteriia bacterium AH_259_A11_L15]|nr:hypothetical protein [Acidobacteriia bacterium AH_259_A11_L15]
MEKHIIEKLRAALSNEVDNECKVVYILCESRKLLDKYPRDPTPFALKLYCHWALHVDLTHARTTLPFLERVDEFAAGILAGKQNEVKENQMLREFVFLDTFKQQFRQFLESYDLPTAICDEDRRWHEFLKLYAGIIEDGSLSCQDKTGSLKLVSEVIFTKGRPITSGTYIPFDLSWNIVLLDGKTMTVDVNAAALPGGNEMIFHGIHLH